MKKLTTLLFCLVTIFLTSNATNYFVDPNISASGNGETWSTAKKTITEAETASTPTNIYIKGGVTIASSTGWTLKAANYYGGFDPNSSNIDPALRPMKDNDGNGIIEPWEFAYPTVFSSSFGGGVAITLSASTTLDGFTITNINTNGLAVTKNNGSTSTMNNQIGGVVQKCIFTGSNLNYSNMISAYPGGCLIKSLGDFKDCLIEKNTVTVSITANYEAKIAPIFEFSFAANVTASSTLSRCVFRNNTANISGNAATNPFTGGYIKGLIINVVTATCTPSQSATISDCLVYNNEINYSGTIVTTLSKASILGTLNYSGNTTVDKWVNNTIANNKMTNCNSAMQVPSNSTQPHYVYNNVFWNNQNNGGAVSMSSSSSQTSPTIISNIMDCASIGTWLTASATYFADNFNKIDLNSKNTTSGSGPQFVNPTTIVGNSNNGTVEKADWRLNTTSYLLTKGAATSTTGISTDKAGNNFVAATPAAGAYEATAIAPIVTGITAGNTTLSVAFTAPAYDGGSSISNYKYSTDGGFTFVPIATANPLVISTQSTSGTPALVNGTSYNVQIKAVNANGDGAASATCIGIPVAASTVPASPIINSITSGNAQLNINFSQGSDGGSDITGYQYSTDGGTTFVPITTANPLVISTQTTSGTPALVNGTGYNVQIKAVNANGAGTATASTAATPSGTVAAPTGITITPANTSLSVAFTAGSNGGSAITNYKYSTNDGATFTACNQTTSPIVISNLNGGTAYKVQIKAVNAAGDGTATASTTATTTSTAPSAPVITGITAGNASLSVVFTTPTNTGGSNITSYKYSTDGGATFSPRASGTTGTPLAISLQSATITPSVALVNTTSYNIQIKAVNAIGDSPASNTCIGVPVATTTNKPAAPTINSITAGSATLTVNFSPGSDGGATISGYKYCTDGTNWSSSASAPILITKQTASNTPNLVNGDSYTIQIRAVNANGDGAIASMAATPVKPEPTNQAQNLAHGTITSSSIPLSFSSAVTGTQAPDGYLLKMSTGTITDPVDGTDPTPDVTTVTLGNANSKILTVGSVASFSGLTAGTMYHYKMFSYTNSGSLINFNTTLAPTLDEATLPAAVSGVTFTPTVDFNSTTLTANLSWTNPGSFDAANHTTLVFVKQSSSSITFGIPTNAPGSYTASTSLLTGSAGTAYQGDLSAYCVYNGNGTNVSLSGMTTGATYNVLIVTVYNTANSDGTYSYSTAATASAVMYKREPVYSASNLGAANVSTTSISLTWTAAQTGSSQDADGYIVVSKAISSSQFPNPQDGIDQTDVTAYTNNLANMKVTPKSATGMSSFTNMTPGTMYYYKVFTYTNSGSQINYKINGSSSPVPTLNYATLPDVVTNVNFLSTNATTATINWTLPNSYVNANHSTLVFVKATSAINQGSPVKIPTDYTANSTFGSGTAYEGDAAAYCVYKGDETSVLIDGLTSNTTYQVMVYTVVDLSNSDATNSYSSSTTATGATILDAPSIVSVVPGSQRIAVNFTAPGLNGGSAITDYKYSTDGGSSFTSAGTTSSPIVITGLTNGNSYAVILKAVNANGDGTASTASASVTPSATANIINITTPTNTGDISLTPVSDIAVSGTTLTVNGSPTVNSITIASNAKLNLSGTNTLTINGDLLLKADQANSFSANIGSGTLAVTGAIKYLRTIDASKWYFMAFPSDVTINQITSTNQTLGTLGVDWFIKYYDGSNRGTYGTGSNWVSIIADQVSADPTLKLNKYQGYIFGLANGKPDTELSFLLDKTVVSTEPTNRSISVAANNAGNGSISNTNFGWNLIGQPYLSNYVGSNTTGTFNIYVSDGVSTYTPYTQSTVPPLNPMAAYFIQASTDLAGTGIIFNTAGRQSVKSVVATDYTSDKVQLNLTSPTGTDYALLTMDNNFTAYYEIGYDLEKWIGTGTDKPQLYTQLNGINYAFNALPMTNVINLPIGFYTKAAGTSTISANAAQAPGLSKLLLTDNSTIPATVTDLMASNYSFTANAGTDNARFVLTAQKVSTANIIETDINDPKLSIANCQLSITNLLPTSTVRVFDAIGRMVAYKVKNNSSLEISLPLVGMYSVQIESGAKSWIRKIVNN
jgi:predicted RNA-binding protein with TRAM domain